MPGSSVLCAVVLLTAMSLLSAAPARGEDYRAWLRNSKLYKDGSLAYWVHTPPAYTAKGPRRRYPLLVILHWSYVRGSEYLHYWRPDGDAHNTIIAAPDSRGGASWLAADGPNIVRMIDAVKRDYDVDEDRIWLAGYSAGGVYVYHLLFTYPNLFHAVLPVGGRVGRHKPQAPADGRQPRHTRVCLFHGEWDVNIRFPEAEADAAFLRDLGYGVTLFRMEKFGHWIPRTRGADFFTCLNGTPIEGLPPLYYPRRPRAVEAARPRYSTYRIPSTGVSLPARPAE